MKIARRPDPEPLHVLAATLRVWLLDVIVWLSEWLGAKLPRDVRMELRREIAQAEREVRLLVVLLALCRMRVPVFDTTPTLRPANAPAGFRRARGMCSDRRAFERGVRLRGRSIAARLARLRRIFDNLGAFARRMVKHLQPRRGGLAIVLVAMCAERLMSLCVTERACADTS